MKEQIDIDSTQNQTNSITSDAILKSKESLIKTLTMNWPLKSEIKNQNSTQTAFEKSAKSYDEDPFTEFLFSAENNIVSELLDISTWDKVLDLWCGTWKYIKLFAKNTEVEITWTDISEKMIQQSVQNNQDSNIEYEIANIEDRLPFPDNSFDKINCAHVLKFILTQEWLENTFKEIARILKPWWVFVFSNNHPDRNFEWEDFKLKRKEEESDNDNEIEMHLHKINNYIQACKTAGLEIEEQVDVTISDNSNYLIKEESFKKTKWKKVIIAFKMKK